MLDPNNLTDRKLLEEARKQQEKFRRDPATTSPRQPAEQLTKDNVLRYWRTCEDGITCMEPAFGRNREEADWVKFSDFAQVVDERDEVYRPKRTPTPEDWRQAKEFARRLEPVAYICPQDCGCMWRDNKDGTMSLYGPNSNSCEKCEVLPLDQLKPVFAVAESASLPVQQAQPPTKCDMCSQPLDAQVEFLNRELANFRRNNSKAAEEREQASNLFWPAKDEFEEHIYEIRNGKTADYIMAHALALAGTFASAVPSTPPASSPGVQALESQWIRVEDMMPCDYQTVLITTTEGHIEMARHCPADDNIRHYSWELERTGPQNDAILLDRDQVTHWAELPAPPVESLSKAKE